MKALIVSDLQEGPVDRGEMMPNMKPATPRPAKSEVDRINLHTYNWGPPWEKEVKLKIHLDKTEVFLSSQETRQLIERLELAIKLMETGTVTYAKLPPIR